ncbi:hypothetical protein [Streptomyces sp. Da 82-17]|uniref:hypothetical protein n=1 Tax=Streptomyces sp. Da 82-17 TaxID=3377116 RepID=UPI0038D46E5C
MHRDEEWPQGVPDEVWDRFLRDDEDAIRRTAPREPSARERTVDLFGTGAGPARRPDGLGADPARPDRLGADPAGPDRVGADAVGELWLPRAVRDSAAWRDLDGRGRIRRAARVLGAVTVLAAALALLSLLPNTPPPQAERPEIAVQEQPSPTPTDRPTAEASASPALFTPPRG